MYDQSEIFQNSFSDKSNLYGMKMNKTLMIVFHSSLYGVVGMQIYFVICRYRAEAKTYSSWIRILGTAGTKKIVQADI